MLTLQDIERRAKARGWECQWNRARDVLRVIVAGRAEARWAALRDGVMLVLDRLSDDDLAYLEGVTEAREGAARVLSVVAQVAAMQWAQQRPLKALAAMSSAAQSYAEQAGQARAKRDALRREVLRLRHRLRERGNRHESGDLLRPEDLDALLGRGLWDKWPAEQRADMRVEITRELAQELRFRREFGSCAYRWLPPVHGPKGRLP